MSLVYVTGVAGSGKSTALDEIKQRGYEVHDADEHLSFWASKSNGAKIDASDHALTTDPRFFDEHDWYIDKLGVANLSKQTNDTNKTVFVCGSVANENEVWSYLDKVFCLYVDDVSLASRLKSRTEKDFGKAEHELTHILALNRNVQEKYTALGAIVIDATQPTKKVVDDIISYLK